MRAKITADEDFKRETKQIRKNVEQETLNAIIRFHQQEIGHFKAETKKGKRASSAIALNTKNCSTIEPARAALAENNVCRNSKTHWLWSHLGFFYYSKVESTTVNTFSNVTGFSHFTMVNTDLVCCGGNCGRMKAKFTIVNFPNTIWFIAGISKLCLSS